MTACRTYQIENRWSAHAANDNVALTAFVERHRPESVHFLFQKLHRAGEILRSGDWAVLEH